jgi:hypothetical protein
MPSEFDSAVIVSSVGCSVAVEMAGFDAAGVTEGVAELQEDKTIVLININNISRLRFLNIFSPCDIFVL